MPLRETLVLVGDGCAASPSCWKASPSHNLESEAGRHGAWKPWAGAAHPPEGMVQTPQLSPAEGTVPGPTQKGLSNLSGGWLLGSGPARTYQQDACLLCSVLC